jgi:hypothetical protein
VLFLIFQHLSAYNASLHEVYSSDIQYRNRPIYTGIGNLNIENTGIGKWSDIAFPITNPFSIGVISGGTGGPPPPHFLEWGMVPSTFNVQKANQNFCPPHFSNQSYATAL